MAFTSNVKYIWPPNFLEGTDVMDKYQRKIAIRATGTSTAADDATDQVIVDKSDLLGPAGAEPDNLVILEATWSISGYDTVILEWDDGTDEEALRMQGDNFVDFTAIGGLHSDGSSQTGDLLLSTLGGAANSSYDIQLVVKLKQ